MRRKGSVSVPFVARIDSDASDHRSPASVVTRGYAANAIACVATEPVLGRRNGAVPATIGRRTATRSFRKRRRGVRSLLVIKGQQTIDLARAESCETEIEVRFLDLLKFQGQQFFIPRCLLVGRLSAKPQVTDRDYI